MAHLFDLNDQVKADDAKVQDAIKRLEERVVDRTDITALARQIKRLDLRCAHAWKHPSPVAQAQL